MARRFAEDTSVPVGRSQDEVKVRLRQAGADQIAIFESDAQSSIAFTAAGRMFRITVPRSAKAKDVRQDERRAWRLLLLLLKAKLEAIREGATTMEREFLADLLLPDGSTVYQRAQEQLAVAYEGGSMPDRLLLEGPRK